MMRIPLSSTPFYYLTAGNTERREHMEREFAAQRPVAVHAVPHTRFDPRDIKHVRTRRSGITGFLRILDTAALSDREFRPFVILEDDAKKHRDMPEALSVPDDTDICYIGLSEWGMTDQPNGSKGTVCFSEVEGCDEVIRIYNMLSTHGLMLCSVRGLLALQKCLVEDFYKKRGWDRSLAQVQPHLRVYALKTPLVYQCAALGGVENERSTRVTHRSLRRRELPASWRNTENLSVLTSANPPEASAALVRCVKPTIIKATPQKGGSLGPAQKRAVGVGEVFRVIGTAQEHYRVSPLAGGGECDGWYVYKPHFAGAASAQTRLLPLPDLLAALPPHVLLRFDNEAFPSYQVGTDIDILVSCLDTSVCAIVDRCASSNFRHALRILQPDVHAHLDMLDDSTGSLHLRFDLYTALPYTRFRLHPGLWSNVLSHRVRRGPVWQPRPQDDLALRYAEYIEHQDRRPEKIKHLRYVEEHGQGVDFARVRPGDTDCTLNYASCEAGFFGFIVWNHGLKHLESIFEMLHQSFVCQVLYIKKLEPPDMDAFLRALYAEDLGGDPAGPLHGHIKAKTRYLASMPRRCLFALLRKPDTRPAGGFDEDLVSFKWSVRSRFNPRSASQPAAGRLPRGVSHHHVIHGIDRPGECGPVCRRITGSAPEHFEHRLAGGRVEVPHHIVAAAPRTLPVSVPIAHLRASIIGRGLVPVHRTPHYEFVCGEERAYREYYGKHCGRELTDGHSCACFRRTLKNFNPVAYLYTRTAYILVKPAASGTWRIVDGVHRSAALCHHYGKEHSIPCYQL